MNMNENITEDSEAVFRALRDTILDAPDGQMSELIADVGMDSKQLAQRARNAVADARAEHQKHQDANNKIYQRGLKFAKKQLQFYKDKI